MSGAAGAGGPLPLLPTQEMQWELMCALSPGDPGASRVLIVDNRLLEGELDAGALRAAFAAVTRRHDALRLVFTSTAPAASVTVLPDVDPPVEFLDLAGLDEAAQRARVDELVFHENRRRFDLRAAPAWHAWVVRLGARRHLLDVCFAHVIADGAACSVFVRDLLAAYAAALEGTQAWREPAPSFAALHTLQAERYAPAAGWSGFWRERLAPVARDATFVRRAGADADLLARAGSAFTLDAATVAGVRRLAWRARTTPFVVLLAAYHLLLSADSGKQRTVIASGTLARPTAAERGAVMQYVSDALVSTDMPDRLSLLGAVQATHEAMTEAVEHVAPFTTVARAVNPAFDASRPWPDYHLCDGHFYAGAGGEPERAAAGLRVRGVYLPGARPPGFRSELTAGRLPATLAVAWEAWCGPSVAVGAQRDRGMFIYNDQVFPHAWGRERAERYRRIVERLVGASDTDVGTLRKDHAQRARA